MQNTSPIKTIGEEITEEDGNIVVSKKSIPGDFVVCNLASLVLGNIDVNDKNELEFVVRTSVRALDNVIDLNFYPVSYAKITNQKYRSIGLGTSGYHHMLINNGIKFQSEEHLAFADKVYEDINYYALKESNYIAKEKGSYAYFKGSDYETGAYFKKRNYTSSRWKELEKEIEKNGLRNGYIMAIAPTGSTSIIAGTTAGIDPVMSRFFIEEKKGALLPRVSPNLNPKTFGYMKMLMRLTKIMLLILLQLDKGTLTRLSL